MIRRLARPYAEALLGAARDLDEARRVRDQLEEFADALDRVPALAKMAVNPAIPVEVKEKVLERLADEMALEPITRRFLRALLVRYRLPLILGYKDTGRGAWLVKAALARRERGVRFPAAV